MDERRVAEIYASHDAHSSYGSGYLIAPGLVLTARHVVAPALDGGACEVRQLGDFLQGRTGWCAFEPCWSEPALDLALLRQVPGSAAYAAGPSQLERLARLQRSDQSPQCVALGFPRVMRHADRNDTQEVKGIVQTMSMMQAGLWQVAVTGAAPKNDLDWKGISGSALFCTGRLVGVIKQTETCFRDGVLVAQPIEAVFEQPGFLQALGVRRETAFETFDPRHDPKPWQALLRLVYLVDRQIPVDELQTAVVDVLEATDAPRAFICAVPGEPEHEHGDLIELFREETMPALFPGKPGFDSIVNIDWPRTAESVQQGLLTLRAQMHTTLGIKGANAQDSARRIAGALNGNDKPRAFYCEIRDSFFTALQRDLVQAWLAEWSKVAGEGLNDFVALFMCLVFDPRPAAPPVPRWKFWAAQPPAASLQDFMREQFDTLDAVRDRDRLRLVRLSKLAPCERRKHLQEWGAKLSARPLHRWLADHVTTVDSEVEQDPFALSTLVAALRRLAQPPTARS